MLYLTSFYCLLHTRQVQVFDDDEHKPISGSCGHTICLECFQNQKSSSCPLCQKENAFEQAKPNYTAIELINRGDEDLRSLLDRWERGENNGEGLCSKCVNTENLRICLTCHQNELCESDGDELKLRMQSEMDLINLARHAICCDCFLEDHAEEGHKSVKIDEIKYSKEEIGALGLGVFLRLRPGFVRNAKRVNSCELQKHVFENIGREICRLLQQTRDTDKDEWSYLEKLIKKELVRKYWEHSAKHMKVFINRDHKANPFCECTRLYEKIEKLGNEEGLNIYKKMAHSANERFTQGCPLWFKCHMEDRLKLYNMIGETLPEEVTPEPSNDTQCPTCAFLDHKEHYNLSDDFNRENWTNIIETIWKSEKPDIKDCCIPCLKVLDRYEVGSSCKHDTQEIIEKMGTEKSLKYEINRLLIQHLERNEYSNYFKCNAKFDCSVFEILSGYIADLVEFMTDMWNIGDHICQLRSLRIQRILLDNVFLVWKKRSEIAELKILYGTFRAYLKKFQSESQEKSHCECTAIWEHNEKMLDKTSRENKSACKKYYDLRNQMKQMANYALERDISGCPMYFDHGIVLDASVLEELEKGSYTDFVETRENMDFDLD